MGVDEDLGVVGAVDGVGAEQPAEEQDLGGQEEPHAELARLELLPRRVEVVGQVRVRAPWPCAAAPACVRRHASPRLMPPASGVPPHVAAGRRVVAEVAEVVGVARPPAASAKLSCGGGDGVLPLERRRRPTGWPAPAAREAASAIR